MSATATSVTEAGAPSPLAIAAITAVLRDLLDNQLARVAAARVGDLSVTALPPDRVTTGSDERPSLNLFLYRVTPNTRWRMAAGGSGALALDLHYLLAAYGEQELQIETLLGHAIHAFHATPVLEGDALATAIASAAERSSGSASQARAALSELASGNAIARLEIVPEFLGMEELARLWSALQAKYRPSLCYRVSAIPLAIREDGG